MGTSVCYCMLHNICLQYDIPSYILELIDKFERNYENRDYFKDDYLQRIKKNITMYLADKDNNDDDRVISLIYDNNFTAKK